MFAAPAAPELLSTLSGQSGQSKSTERPSPSPSRSSLGRKRKSSPCADDEAVSSDGAPLTDVTNGHKRRVTSDWRSVPPPSASTAASSAPPSPADSDGGEHDADEDCGGSGGGGGDADSCVECMLLRHQQSKAKTCLPAFDERFPAEHWSMNSTDDDGDDDEESEPKGERHESDCGVAERGVPDAPPMCVKHATSTSAAHVDPAPADGDRRPEHEGSSSASASDQDGCTPEEVVATESSSSSASSHAVTHVGDVVVATTVEVAEESKEGDSTNEASVSSSSHTPVSLEDYECWSSHDMMIKFLESPVKEEQEGAVAPVPSHANTALSAAAGVTSSSSASSSLQSSQPSGVSTSSSVSHGEPKTGATNRVPVSSSSSTFAHDKENERQRRVRRKSARIAARAQKQRNFVPVAVTSSASALAPAASSKAAERSGTSSSSSATGRRRVTFSAGYRGASATSSFSLHRRFASSRRRVTWHGPATPMSAKRASPTSSPPNLPSRKRARRKTPQLGTNGTVNQSNRLVANYDQLVLRGELLRHVDARNLDGVISCLKRGADPNFRVENGCLLSRAMTRVLYGNQASTEIFQRLCQAGASLALIKRVPDEKSRSHVITRVDGIGFVKDMARTLHYFGCDPDNVYLNFALSLVLKTCKLDDVRALLHAGADPNAVVCGQSMLVRAICAEPKKVWSGHAWVAPDNASRRVLQLAECLLEAGADANLSEAEAQQQQPPADHCTDAASASLAPHHAPVTPTTRRSACTALVRPVANPHSAALAEQQPEEASASPRRPPRLNHVNLSPLMASCQLSTDHVFRLLVDRGGADLTHTYKRNNVIHHVIEANVARWLETVVEYARTRRLRLLNDRNGEGDTPLMVLCRRRMRHYTDEQFVHYFSALLKGGADPHLVDADGRSLATICLENGDTRLAAKFGELELVYGCLAYWAPLDIQRLIAVDYWFDADRF